MTLLQNKHIQLEKLIKEIEKGKTSVSNASSLMQILNDRPSMVPEVIRSLSYIMAKVDQKPYISACLVLNLITDEYPDIVSDSLEMIIGLLKYREKELDEHEWVPTLELLTKINQGHPEKINIAVPGLLSALGNSNANMREAAYFLLALIATNNPDFFKDRSKELIRVLNGINLDERIYGCKIIGKIAEKNPEIVEKTYDVVEDLFLNHPDNDLRREAGFAADKLRPKGTVRQPDIVVAAADQQDIQSDLDTLSFEGSIINDEPKTANIATGFYKAGLTETEITPGKEIDIKDRSHIETALKIIMKGGVIDSATLVDADGRVISHTGTEIDNSLLAKIVSIISLDSDDAFKKRVTIEQTDKNIIAVRVGNKAILMVATGADTSIGMLFLTLNKSIENLNDVLMDAGFS
jgi:predicted regulator of Ras-like GTPase activity (Roadblock/LC7/MglB family)